MAFLLTCANCGARVWARTREPDGQLLRCPECGDTFPGRADAVVPDEGESEPKPRKGDREARVRSRRPLYIVLGMLALLLLGGVVFLLRFKGGIPGLGGEANTEGMAGPTGEIDPAAIRARLGVRAPRELPKAHFIYMP